MHLDVFGDIPHHPSAPADASSPLPSTRRRRSSGHGRSAVTRRDWSRPQVGADDVGVVLAAGADGPNVADMLSALGVMAPDTASRHLGTATAPAAPPSRHQPQDVAV